MIGPLAVGGRGALVDPHPLQFDIVQPVKRQRLRRGAVAARAADLLIIAFHRFRQVGMGHPADVRLVDAHAEGDGRADHQVVLPLEPVLRLLPDLRFQSGVIGQGGDARVAERLGQHLRLVAGRGVDDPRPSLPRGDEVQQLPTRPVLGGEGEVDVRAVEAVDEGARRRIEQLANDLRPRLLIRRRGESGDLGVAEARPQFADPEVIGPEVMPPLADAMRFIDGQKAHPNPAEKLRGGIQSFRRQIEQLQRSPVDRLEHLFVLIRVVGRSQRARLHPRFAQRPDLIAHQGDERGNDQRHTLPPDRGQLIAKRFASSRRHDGERVLTVQDRLDDLRLTRAEIVKAEDGGEEGAGGLHGAEV